MNISEAAAVLAKAAAFDGRTVTRESAAAWADAMAEVPIDQALTAVGDHYRMMARWIMPADILKMTAEPSNSGSAEWMRAL